MGFYAGIDLGKRKSQIKVMTQQRKVVEDLKIENDPKKFARIFRKYKGHFEVACEACSNAFWVADILGQLVRKVHIGHPKKNRWIAEARIKSDKIDAGILAELVRVDHFPSIAIPPKRIRDLRAKGQRLHWRLNGLRVPVATEKSHTLFILLDRRPHSLYKKTIVSLSEEIVILELNTYKTKDGIAPGDHRDAVRLAHQATNPGRPGLLQRVVGQIAGDDKTWADIAIWDSREHFAAGAAEIPNDPAARPWLSQIDMASLKMQTLALTGTIGIKPGAITDAAIGCWSIVSWRIFPNVDPEEHRASGAHVHREILAKFPGYRGAYMTRPIDGNDWLDVVGWDTAEMASQGIEGATEISVSGTDAVAKRHIADADPASVRLYIVTGLQVL